MNFSTLADMLKSLNNQEKRGITFINDEGADNFLSYKELYENSLKLLYLLQSRGLKERDELVFQLEDNRDFLIAFWASIMGGIIPVPITVGNKSEHKDKLLAVWATLNSPYLITDSRGAAALEKHFKKKRRLDAELLLERAIIIDKVELQQQEIGNIHSSQPEEIAFIQFSSGSTGAPKGVTLTHKNLLSNTSAIRERTALRDNDKMLSWLPLTHDMGLILVHLTALLAGLEQYLIPTELFIEKPLLWLETASKYKTTLLFSPNFGFKYLLNFLQEPKDWELSSIRMFFNGGEPISYQLCTAFFEALADYGLHKGLMYPGYGIAEASVAAAMSPQGEAGAIPVYLDREQLSVGDSILEKSDGAIFIELGSVAKDCRIRICDDEDKELGEKRVGHIQLKGDNVTPGYYNNPEATAKAFTSEGWLRTGDLGFLRGDRLVITGRAKDVIIVNGKNYYAADLEQICHQLEELGPGKVAAAGIYNETLQQEEIVFFIRYSKCRLPEFSGLVLRIRELIRDEVDIEIDRFIPVRRIPRTTSGKIERYKLIKDYVLGLYSELAAEVDKEIVNLSEVDSSLISEITASKDRERLFAFIGGLVEQVVGAEIPDYDESFRDLGLGSIEMVRLKTILEEQLELDIPASFVIDYPTMNRILEKIEELIFSKEDEASLEKKANCSEEVSPEGDFFHESIAIVALACRFPGAENGAQFWANLEAGVDGVGRIPMERWDNESYYSPGGEPGTIVTKDGGFLKDIALFDPRRFGITPLEAKEIDPQQRILLELSSEALQMGGFSIPELEGSRTAVYMGLSFSEYKELAKGPLSGYGLTGSMLSTASGRISYTFGFRGPCQTIDTACSSSLVAVHQAVRSLRMVEADMALAGGVNLILSPQGHISLTELKALSPRGRCRPFSDGADGYVRSEGGGVVVLKRYGDALRDNDKVLALIKGSALNHDGRSSGLTVPSGPAQEDVIEQALADSGLSPAGIDYLEAHGTGTKLGDSQELTSLDNIFSREKRGGRKLVISSVKANIGHAESAAGIAGLIKVIYALRNKRFPPQLYCERLTNYIDWEKTALEVRQTASPWIKVQEVRRAGLSSFGISGTNCHLIVEEHLGNRERLDYENIALEGDYKVLPLSASTERELTLTIESFLDFLRESRERLEDICYTAARSRSGYKIRALFFGKDKDELIGRMRDYLNSDFTSWEEHFPRELPPLMAESGRSYCKGEKIEWARLLPYRGEEVVELPLYPMQREHFWLDEPVKGEADPIVERKRITDMDEIKVIVRTMIREVSGYELDEEHFEDSFFNLGFDSLMFAKLGKKVGEHFNLEIGLQKIMAELTTPNRLVAYIEVEAGPISASTSDEEKVTVKSSASTVSREVGESALERVIFEQMRLMERQLELLKESERREAATKSAVKGKSTDKFKGLAAISMGKENYKDETFSALQEDFIKELINRYTLKTKGSLEYREKNSYRYSHWLTALNYRRALRELVYPLVTRSAEGAYFTDIDGNSYLDLAIGYGVHFFGHKRSFITEAIEKQLKSHYVLSPMPEGIGEAAALISELTGVERVCFCNTGSEAVMFAMRIARTVSGRSKIVRFAGAYHGVYDGVLVESDEEGSSFPTANGIMQGAVEDTVVLSYGTEESLEQIKALSGELAAVLVEPVQSRRPGFQPVEYLKKLRKVTEERGIALIFDEIITGFRVHPGGVMGLWGIEAELVTYGKIIGGGMPIGVVAGRGYYLDAVDGGEWSLKEESEPVKEKTYIAGTFANHPLSIAAVGAVCRHILENGASLYEDVNRKMDYLIGELNSFFQEEEVPIAVRNFGPLFRFESYGSYDLALQPIEMELFFFLLLERGIYTWERRICFLSTIHNDDDIMKIIKTVKESIYELRRGGFTFRVGGGSRPKSKRRKSFPLLPTQERYYVLNGLTRYESAAHLCATLKVNGLLDISKVRESAAYLVKRHDALRTCFATEDDDVVQRVLPSVEPALSIIQTGGRALEELIDEAVVKFELGEAPLFRITIFQSSEEDYTILFDIHRLVADGLSTTLIMQDFMKLYNGEQPLPLKAGYFDFLESSFTLYNSASYTAQERYWIDKGGDLGAVTTLSILSEERGEPSDECLLTISVGEKLMEELKSRACLFQTTPFILFLSCFNLLLYSVVNEERIVHGIPVSCRTRGDYGETVGAFGNTVFLVNRLESSMTFAQFLKNIRKESITAFENRDYPFERLLEALECDSQRQLINIMFSYEKSRRNITLKGLECRESDYHKSVAAFQLLMEVVEAEQFTINFRYAEKELSREQVELWKERFLKILSSIPEDGTLPLSSLLEKLGYPEESREEHILARFREITGIESIESDDVILDLPVSSLKALKLVKELQKDYKVNLLDFMKYPTIKSLAESIRPKAESLNLSQV